MNALTIRRVVKARQAMMRAQDPKFKLFWNNVIKSLIEADESLQSRSFH